MSSYNDNDRIFMDILDKVASLDIDYMGALIDNIEIMIENKEEELRETMRKVDVNKFVSNGLEVKLTKDSVRHNFDSKSFKEDNIELYNKYLKTTNVKGSLSIELERGI